MRWVMLGTCVYLFIWVCIQPGPSFLPPMAVGMILGHLLYEALHNKEGAQQ